MYFNSLISLQERLLLYYDGSNEIEELSKVNDGQRIQIFIRIPYT